MALTESLEKLERNIERLDDLIEGDENATITTESGATKPSISKAVHDVVDPIAGLYGTSAFLGFYSGPLDGINFDFINHVITTTSGCSVINRNTRYSILADQSIDISTISSAYYYVVYIYPATGVIGYMRQGVGSVPADALAFCSFSSKHLAVYNLEYCLINGVQKSEHIRNRVALDKYVIEDDITGYYTAPAQASGSSTSDNYLNNLTSTSMHVLYDALVTAYPSYVTKTVLGTETTGLPIHRYDFLPIRPSTESTKFPKVFMTSGHHNEQMGVWATYLFLKSLCDSWEDDSLLEILRHNVHFIVIPVVNPYGFNNHQRKNFNDVDPNRNYPAEWVLTEVGTSTYSGTAPLSEPEIALVYAEMVQEAPFLLMIDHHSYATTQTNHEFLWAPSESIMAQTCAGALFSKLTRKWHTENSWMPDGSTSALMIGYADTSPGGTSVAQAGALGAQAISWEAAHTLWYEPDAVPYSAIGIRYALEALTNIILMMLKKLIQTN